MITHDARVTMGLRFSVSKSWNATEENWTSQLKSQTDKNTSLIKCFGCQWLHQRPILRELSKIIARPHRIDVDDKCILRDFSDTFVKMSSSLFLDLRKHRRKTSRKFFKISAKPQPTKYRKNYVKTTSSEAKWSSNIHMPKQTSLVI